MTPATTTRTGRPEKRAAIDRAACAVFGREGYTRASVDAIAAEAGVSKRTIYNHHQDKEQLFLSVLRESTLAVAAHQKELIDRHLTDPADLGAELRTLGRALATPQEGFEGHFALVRVIFAEAGRLPVEFIESWHEHGPRQSRAHLTLRLGALAASGRLRTDDPARTAAHFTQLATSEVYERSFHGALPLPREEVEALVDSGVDAFLRLYGGDR
ncbi:TetR/AcrR family transcriptional regulator [Streptomyces sp. ISL-11]|uniref:TetR/AcrR family transcriptional regulator n=1 Tax=Streptomyces sp. ISL-11 TaxID=2819174 RepID=UPI001BE9384F|nr:TetR/AcrR family transcriptional regulator [Streptomyces sp. ISL-11]MBT2384333.1 TetR/AcrR family transcriptional regulator [Streptomyces sp. ISL-11]